MKPEENPDMTTITDPFNQNQNPAQPEAHSQLRPPADGAYGFQPNVSVTPDDAEWLIGRNAENNRNKKEVVIIRYARDMRAGRWLDKTGETVKIDPEGWMIDGNNRMHAVVASGTTQVFDIAWNVPNDRMLVIDGNSPRSVSDDFRIHQVRDRFLGASLVRWAIGFEKGNYVNHGGRLTPTRPEMRERYMLEPQTFDRAITYGRSTWQHIKGINATTAAMAYWLFAKIDESKAEDFFDSLITGIDLPATSPIYAVRNRLTSNQSRPLKRTEQLVLLIKAWNLFRRGDDAPVSGRILVGSKAPVSNENFPKPI
jgi:hypothetical protein